MTAEEQESWDLHLAKCKKVALEYVDRGEIADGLTSMMSDVTKHEHGRNHKGCELGVGLMLIGALNSPQEARRFIEGFR